MSATTTQPALWKIGTASAEGSEWEGEYRGTMVRLVRVTDFNVWPGRNPERREGCHHDALGRIRG